MFQLFWINTEAKMLASVQAVKTKIWFEKKNLVINQTENSSML